MRKTLITLQMRYSAIGDAKSPEERDKCIEEFRQCLAVERDAISTKDMGEWIDRLRHEYGAYPRR